MHYRDHEPPHFHARYQEHKVLIEIESGLIRGSFPKRALRLLVEWMELHGEELDRNRARARRGERLRSVAEPEGIEVAQIA